MGKTYKKAKKEIELVLSRHPEYDGFEVKFWGSRMFIRDPKGWSFSFHFDECPIYRFDIMPPKDGTERKNGWGGYKLFLKPDDYKIGRDRKPWLFGNEIPIKN